MTAEEFWTRWASGGNDGGGIPDTMGVRRKMAAGGSGREGVRRKMAAGDSGREGVRRKMAAGNSGREGV